jgi:ribosome-associated translation inhibitor RaiA
VTNQQVVAPTILVHGDVPDQMVAYGRDKLLAVVARTRVPVLSAELRLDHHADPARERPNHVEMTVDLNGIVVRARRSAPAIAEAIDRTEERLRRRVEAATDGPQSRQLRHRDEQGWHHDDRPTERPHFYPRPPEQRELVRRKTFALRPESIEEALFDLEMLDHDFFLFVHNETNAEAVVYVLGDGCGIVQRVPTPEAVKDVGVPLDIGPHPATTTLENALTVLDEADTPFEFFIDAATARGMVVYRRYDGHYGLVVPS